MSKVDKKNVVEELPCPLTDEETLEMSSKLAGLHQQKLEVEGKKKEAVNDFGVRIKKIDAEVHLLSNNIYSGKETRNVECRMDYDWPAGKKTLVRLDTGEVVREEVISDFERQQHMEFVERENGKAAKEDWPEEEVAEETGPVICGDCGSSGDEHSDDCPTLSEEMAEDAAPEGTEESEEEPGQEETGDEVPEEVEPEEPTEEEQPEPEAVEDNCFGQFDADDETCQGCSQSADCFEETPESKADEVPADEKSDDLPPRHKCAKCEEFFEEPKDNEDEYDTTSCPLCGSSNWM